MSEALARRESSELQRVEQFDIAGVTRSIIEAAKDPAVDANKAQTMMNMVLQMQDRHAAQLFNEAKTRIQNKMPRISPNGVIKNKADINGVATVRSRYMLYEDVDRFLRPLLAEEGMAVSFDDGVFANGVLTLTMEISHVGGHVVARKIPMPLANTPGASEPQKMAGTMSFAKRVGLVNYFNIIQEGIDNDGQGTENEPLTEEQLKVLDALMRETATSPERFGKFMKVAQVSDITQGMFTYARKSLEGKRK